MRTWLAAFLALLIITIGIANGADPPYYFRNITTPINSGLVNFSGLSGQGTCGFTLNSQGGSNTTVNSIQLIMGQGTSPAITLYDSSGNSLGTTFSTIGQKSAWFPCPNASGVNVNITPAGLYTYTFIATSFAWPYGSAVNGGGGASPCPTSLVNGGCNVNQLNGDEGKSLNLQVTVSGSLATASTTFLIVAGSTTQNRIVWSSGIAGNAVAAVTAIYKVGQTNVSACDTNCVSWTPLVGLSSNAGNITCFWGAPTPPSTFGMCGILSGGIPLPATNPATNLYVTIGSTAPTAGTAATSYWTNQF